MSPGRAARLGPSLPRDVGDTGCVTSLRRKVGMQESPPQSSSSGTCSSSTCVTPETVLGPENRVWQREPWQSLRAPAAAEPRGAGPSPAARHTGSAPPMRPVVSSQGPALKEPGRHPAILLLGIHPRERRTGSPTKTCTSPFTAALFTLAERWTRASCPWVHPRMTGQTTQANRTRDTHSAVKRMTLSRMLRQGRTLKTRLLRQRSQTQKTTCGVVPCLGSVQSEQTRRDGRRVSGCQGLGEWVRRGALPLGLEFPSGATGKFCNGVSVVAAQQHCNCT